MIYKCDDCDREYKTKARQHINFKHSKVQSLQCLKCDKHFLNTYSLQQHIYKVHPNLFTLVHFVGQVSRQVKIF
jgi:hypothetical protein